MFKTRKELKSQARHALLGNYTTIAFGILLTAIIGNILHMIFDFAIGDPVTLSQIILSLAASFLISLVLSLFSTGTCLMTLKTARIDKFSFSDLFFAFKNSPDRYLVATLIESLLLIATFAPALFTFLYALKHSEVSVAALILSWVGTVLFFVVVLNLFPLVYLMLDHPEITALEAIRMSIRIMRGHKLQLLKLLFSYLPSLLLIILSFGIGSLWALPYIYVTNAFFYLDITTQKQPDPAV